jgi:uncharacterized membrane protein SirB2
MSYLALKHIHISLAIISVSFFVLRYIWRHQSSVRLQQRWVKIAPHAIDSALLLSAIGLMVWSEQYPLQQTWISAKIVALIGYIMFGILALKCTTTSKRTHLYFCAALGCVFLMVWLARTKFMLSSMM